jgi:hypothetical protein
MDRQFGRSAENGKPPWTTHLFLLPLYGFCTTQNPYNGSKNKWVVSVGCSSEFNSDSKEDAIEWANDFAAKWEKLGCEVIVK